MKLSFLQPGLVVSALAFFVALAIVPTAARAQFTTVIDVPPNIGDSAPSLRSNTQLNMTSGSIGIGFSAGFSTGTSSNIEVNVSGGEVARNFRANAGSTVNISGGTFDEFFFAAVGSDINLSGGSFGRNFDVAPGASLQIFGGEFRVDGTLIDLSASPGQALPANLPMGSILSGTLANGTPFAFLKTANNFVSDDIVDGTMTLHYVELPPIESELIVAPSDVVPLGIRGGQTLMVSAGGSVPAFFNAGRGSVVHIAGGEVGQGFDAVAAEVNVSGGTIGRTFSALEGSVVNVTGGVIDRSMSVWNGSTVNISGGVVGADNQSSLAAFQNSIVNISGGTIGPFLTPNSGSTVNITGGNIGHHFTPMAGSTVNISGGRVDSGFDGRGGAVLITGGSFGSSFLARDGTVLTIRGGSFDYDFDVSANSVANISGGSFGDDFDITSSTARVTLSGGDFRLNGASVGGLATLGNVVPLNIPAAGMLTGILADGTPFALSRAEAESVPNGTLQLQAAAVAPIVPGQITASIDVIPLGIRGGQSLLADAGGVVGDNFNAGPGSMIQVQPGGSIGVNLEASGAVVNILGGQVGNNADALNGSSFTVSGGSLGSNFQAYLESTINIVSGAVGYDFLASNSTVNISGGVVGGSFSAGPGSKVVVSGGSMGSDIEADSGSAVSVFGSQFIVGGMDITSTLTQNTPYVITTRDVMLTGTLADGLPLNLDLHTSHYFGDYIVPGFSAGATLNVTLVSGIPGDFNDDGLVNAADYTVWRNRVGTSVAIRGKAGDGNYDGFVTQADYYVWKKHYGGGGSGLGHGASFDERFPVNVPEPAGVFLALAAVLAAGFVRSRLR